MSDIRIARKRPIDVETWAFDGTNGHKIMNWIHSYKPDVLIEADLESSDPWIMIPSLEGPVKAKTGHVIVKGIRDEFWPIDGEIFAESYEYM